MSSNNNSDEPIVLWDRPKLERLKIVYSEAKEKDGVVKTDSFWFDGLEFVIGYADRLVVFLEEGLLR